MSESQQPLQRTHPRPAGTVQPWEKKREQMPEMTGDEQLVKNSWEEIDFLPGGSVGGAYLPEDEKESDQKRGAAPHELILLNGPLPPPPRSGPAPIGRGSRARLRAAASAL